MTAALPWRERAELAAAVALIAWRLAVPSRQGLWRDWILVLGVYWIVLILDRAGRSGPWPTVVAVVYLFAVHALRSLPLTLDHLRLVL